MYDINVDMYLNDEYTKIDSNVGNPIFACKGVYHPLNHTALCLNVQTCYFNKNAKYSL